MYGITIPEDILGIKLEKKDVKIQKIEDEQSDECKMIVATETLISTSEEDKMEPESLQLVVSSSSPSLEDYASILKILRQRLERHYRNIDGGIPEQLISDLDLFETTHHIHRDPTTSSVWNVSRQEYREVFIGKIGEVIIYREKCVCGEDVCADDLFCPCNIPSIDEEEETPAQKAAGARRKRRKSMRRIYGKNRDKALSSIMAMPGLHDLKAYFQALCTRPDTARRQGASLKGERFGTMFIGNSGTGKMTAAKHYAKLLYALGVVGSEKFKETNAIILCDGGVDRTMRYI